MSIQKIISRIRELMASEFGITPAFVAADASLDGLGLDSLDRCVLCMELEAQYGVCVSEEECYETKTVYELALVVAEKVEKAGKAHGFAKSQVSNQAKAERKRK